MDISYTRKKLHEATALAEQAKAQPHDEKVFSAFTAAMGAFYTCMEWLPDELQGDARKAYDKLNEALEVDE